MEETDEQKPKRSKRESSSYKSKAFERFKQLRTGTRKKYEVEELDSVYETVDEKEYTKRVLDRQDDDWIVNDDGSGYIEDGREIFDDDLDHESIAAASTSKGKGIKRKKKQVSENASKGNLQKMLSNMPTKKKKEESLNDDDMLNEILDEIDEKPIEIRPKSTLFTSSKQTAKDYLKTFSSPAVKTTVQKADDNILKEVQNFVDATTEVEIEEKVEKLIENNEKIPENPEISAVPDSLNESVLSTQLSTDMDIDFSEIDRIENTQTESSAGNKWDNFEQDMSDFSNPLNMSLTENSQITENSEIPLIEIEDGQKIFRFFWWDAYEDPINRPGIVLLFGKILVENGKKFISCCVVIKGIERKLHFLPRKTFKDKDSPVSHKDVYNEVNEIMKSLGVGNFKSKVVTKKYAFDTQIPAEAEYLEAGTATIKSKEGTTFSHIFGTESSFLELLLIDRKIKGPCWLDISNGSLVKNPCSWCQLEIDCTNINNISPTLNLANLAMPPLKTASINMRRAYNSQTNQNEIVMISCVVQNEYSIDKQIPTNFQKHFCLFTNPKNLIMPLDIYQTISKYKATNVIKLATEKALLNAFINNFSKIDADLIVGHELHKHQLTFLSERLIFYSIDNFSKLSRVKRSQIDKQKLEKILFIGRLMCDIKISAKELIKCRSYDLDNLCQTVLNLKEGQRLDLEPEDIPKMYQDSQNILKLISITMQDTAFILRIMYNLNIIPLALQITKIAGNVMSKTLMGGRAERNEFLLLHAFTEKGYIVPDKSVKKKEDKSKSTYLGGLVLDPKIGFYDKFILLMDFNSLYPSIIQEYNICFTTILSNDNSLPGKSAPLGILPTEIRKLVESRREVKKLMTSDTNPDLRSQYNIRQMALKLTANSMYGCLGFSQSRFYAKNLASLITQKGREILTNTKDLVQKSGYDVIYGDTDSIMINTSIIDYDQVIKIGNKIKQDVNRLYRQVELDIDGVFKYMLLLKKKKYAAVILSKGTNGELKAEIEYKGLDIVRRDWSQLAAEAGKYVLTQILSDQNQDDRINNIHDHLTKLRDDLQNNRVPLSLLVITKQLTKNPINYNENNTLAHVQVALRCNKTGGHFRAGDTVSYVICEDGTTNPYTKRAYHIEELKNNKDLKIDVNYYLAQQIHPVVTRICDPIDGIDSYRIAENLGLDLSNFKRAKKDDEIFTENIMQPEVKFRNCDNFIFKCNCGEENIIDKPLQGLEKCINLNCKLKPFNYLNKIRYQLINIVNSYIKKYYNYVLICEDPICTNEIRRLPLEFLGRYPVCTLCKNGVMFLKYNEMNLYLQLSYFHYLFDVNKHNKKPIMDPQIENAYNSLKTIVDSKLDYSDYSVVHLKDIFSILEKNKTAKEEEELKIEFDLEIDEDFE